MSLIVTIFCSMLSACSILPYEDPIAVMLDREVEWRFRRRATTQVEMMRPLNPRCIAAWHQLVWERGYPYWQRQHAINQLIRYDESAFRRALAKRVTQVTDWETLNYLFELAVVHNWTDFTPTAIRSYARSDPSIPDLQRPERQVISQLNPGRQVEQVAWTLLANEQQQVTLGEQVAAWILLGRLLDRESLSAHLSQIPASDSLAADLQAAVSQLFVLPLQSEELLRLKYWRHPQYRSDWQRAVVVVRKLGPNQRQGLQLRHIPVVLQADVDTMAMDLAELQTRVANEIPRQTRRLSSDHDVQSVRHQEKTDHWVNRLCWGDLVTVRQILSALRDPSVVQDLFKQADADHDDTRTEYGGVLDVSGAQFEARCHPPLMVRHDRIFYPPPAMIERLYTALAHYHFHVQEYRNGQHAGPGGGDLRFAKRMNFNCLVLAFTDRDQLAVHYYQGNGAVIHLGEIKRPVGTG